MDFTETLPEPAVPCAHVADYYDRRQQEHHCIGHNLLRHGYRLWAEGRVTNPEVNNLFGPFADV